MNADPLAGTTDAEAAFDLAPVWEALSEVYDPEIPVNIVDLGLIYDCHAVALEGGAGHRLDVTMTLTAPGCGMAGFIAEDVRRRVAEVPGVADVRVQVVFDPPWSRDRMSEAARLALG